MPARLLRDWTDSDRLNALKPETERFFVRLIMKADDYGLYTANTRLLRASLFPLLLTEVTDADITRWLAQCQQAGILRLYQAQGKEYIEIINFGQRLRKARAKHPIPEDYGQYAAARGQLQPSHSEATTTGSGYTTTCGGLPASDGELTTIGGGLHATRGESPPIDGNSPPEVEVEYEVEVEVEHSPLSPSGESAPPSAAAPLNVFDRTSQSPSPYTEGLMVSPHSVAPSPQVPPLNITGNTSQSPSPLGEGLEVRPSPSPGTQGAGASPPSVAPAPQSPPLNVTGNTSQSPPPLGEGLGVRQSPQTGYTGVLSPPNIPFANMYHNMGNHALFRPKTDDEVFKAWALLIPSLPTTALERRKALGDFIRQYRPVFIEPYATLWNLFALDNGLNQLHHLTERRRQKLSIRAREGPFDFVALLIQVKKSPFALGDNTRGWKIDFDYLLECESNYIKILEGKFEG